jgi:chloramphenicol 3-O-phosphotransferase
MQPRIILITGASAAGKSTVAQALAERLPKAAHLRGDAFRKMIVAGRAEAPGPELSDEFRAQLQLRYDIACEAARRYAEAGFQVVYQDVIVGPALLDIVDRLRPLGLAVIVLDPDPAVVAAREAGRGKTAYRGAWTAQDFVRSVRETTPRIGLWLDTSAMSVAETAQTILDRLAEARV